MDKTIVKDGWLYRNGFLRKNCKIRLTDITQMKRIAKISARNRNVDWLQVKIAEIKKDKKKLERKK